MEVLKAFKREGALTLRETFIEAPTFVRVLAQDSAAAFSGSAVNIARTMSLNDLAWLAFVVGVGVAIIGSQRLDKKIQRFKENYRAEV